MVKFKIPKIVGFLILISILFGLGYLLPYTVVLAKEGLLNESIKEQLAIYSDIIIFGFAMVLIYGVNYFWKKDDKYGNNIGIYNKEETIFKKFTYPQLTFLSSIFFVGIFILLKATNVLKQGFFGLRVVSQQFSSVDSIIVSSFHIPIPENFMAGFTIGLISLAITFISIKYNVKPANHKIYKSTAVILGLSLFGFLWHQTVYGSSSIASSVVAVFWGLGALISLATGFFVPFLILHITNNFFIDFGRLYSSDFVFGFTIVSLLVLIIFYGFIYRKDGNWWKGANR